MFVYLSSVFCFKAIELIMRNIYAVLNASNCIMRALIEIRAAITWMS